MIKGVLFDMDGVLVDSEPVITQAAILALREFGIEAKTADFKPFTGMGEIKFIGGAAEANGYKYEPAMKDRTYEIYGEIVDSTLNVYKNTRATLEALADVKKALASSADLVKVRHNLRVAGIPLSAFDAIITAEDAGEKKPSPEIYLKAAAKIGVAPEDCAVVEDALSGVAAGRAAGATVIAISTSFSKEQLIEAGADYAVDDIWEIVGVLRGDA